MTEKDWHKKTKEDWNTEARMKNDKKGLNNSEDWRKKKDRLKEDNG